MKQDGVEIAARFAYKPHEKGYCGMFCSPDSKDILRSYIINNKNSEEAKKQLLKFESMPIYLAQIAKVNGLDIWHPKVSHAYFIGNELLDAFRKKDNLPIVEGLIKKAGQRELRMKQYEQMWEGFPPHHNSHVMFMEGGNTYGKIPTNIKSMDDCRTSWGKVKNVYQPKKQLVVETNTLVREDSKILLQDLVKTISYDPQTIQPKVNDNIAIHWESATMIITEADIDALKKYTQKILDKRNKDGFVFFK